MNKKQIKDQMAKKEAEKKARAEAKRLLLSNENKEQKFVRLASSRMEKVLADMDSLIKLSNRNVYTFTPEQIKVMADAITTKVDTLNEAFSKTDVTKKKTFSF
jgi:hypothetical protein